ncbi:MAG: hypothetical protein NVSMB57_02470 [Actinomycetota bacterium]
MAGKQGALQARQHGVLIAAKTGERIGSGANCRDQIVAQLIFERAVDPSRRAKLTQRGRKR